MKTDTIARVANEIEILPPELLQNVQRIVLLWIGRLGDLIVSTPVIRSIRTGFPNARIALVVGAKGDEAARLISDVDEVEVLADSWNIPAQLRLLWKLRRAGTDLLIDLNSSASKSSASLSLATHARIKLAFDKNIFNFCYTHLLAAPNEKEPMLERYARLARALNATYDPKPKVQLDPKDLQRAREILKNLAPLPLPDRQAGSPLSSDARWIAIHPGNFKKFDNRWPEEKFTELTNRILDIPDVRIVYLAGPGETEPVLQIVSRLRRPVPILQPMPVGTTAAVLSLVDLYLGNCTGTTHLAIAVGTSTFTILSGYTKAIWMPRDGNRAPGTASGTAVLGDVSEGAALAGKENAFFGPVPGIGPHFSVVSDSWTSCRDIPVEKVWKALGDVLKTLRRAPVHRQ